MCPLWALPPIKVEIRDAEFRLPAAQGSTVTFRAGRQVAVARPAMDGQFEVVATSGGPGTYSVVVQKDDYEDWVRNGVRVPGNQCGVAKSVVLRAYLKRI